MLLHWSFGLLNRIKWHNRVEIESRDCQDEKLHFTVAAPISCRSRDLNSVHLLVVLCNVTTKVTWFGSTPVVRQIWPLLPPPPRAFKRRNVENPPRPWDGGIFSAPFQFSWVQVGLQYEKCGVEEHTCFRCCGFLITGHYPGQTIISPPLLHFWAFRDHLPSICCIFRAGIFSTCWV